MSTTGVPPVGRRLALPSLCVALAAAIAAGGWVFAQPRRLIPTLRGMEVVPAGAHLSSPSSSPQAWILSAGVAVDRDQWRRSVREGIDGRVTVEQDRSGLTRLRIVPAAGGAPVLVTARLPFDSSELVDFLGTPATGSYRETALDGDGGGQCLRYQVSTNRARLEILLAEGMTPATLRVDGVEVVQQSAARAFATPSSGWNYPVPVAVMMGDSRTELWQRQVVVLEGSQSGPLLVGVTTSTVARPRGTARHLLDGDPYLFGAVVLVAR